MLGEVKRIWYNAETKKYVIDDHEGAKRTDLVCDATTKIVYYKCSGRRNEGFMSPYIGLNGKFCRFIDNQIVEIG